jgi:DNA-3-methyladenine glycosylase II
MLFASSGFLPATAPFEFAHSLAFIGDFGPLRDDAALAGDSLMRAMLIDGQTIVFRVRAPGDAPGLEYQLWSDQPLSSQAIEAAEDRIGFFLSLGDDLGPLYALARHDPTFQKVIEQLAGYHQVKFPTPFENTCWAILSQRNTSASARAMRGALAERYGARLEIEGVEWRAFPEPEAVAEAGTGEVTAAIGHSQKGPVISAVAAAFSTIDERWLRVAPYEEAERWLLDIHGVGPWTATFVLLRGVGRMERLPKGERKLLAAAGRIYRPGGGPVSERELERLAEPYGALKGYWAHYLRVAA